MEKKINASVFGLILFLLLSNPCRKVMDSFTDGAYSTEEARKVQQQTWVATWFPPEATSAPSPEDTEPAQPAPLPTLTPYPTFTVQEETSVTITLISENCEGQYFFVDGQMVAYVEAYGTATFQTTKGEHTLQSCKDQARQYCGDPTYYTFEEDTQHKIFAHPSCR